MVFRQEREKRELPVNEKSESTKEKNQNSESADEGSTTELQKLANEQGHY